MKTCKKLGKILLCAGMLTAAAAVPAFAADAQTQTEPNVTFTVNKTEVAVGEDVTVTISNKETTLAGIGFYLSFDMPKLYCKAVNESAADTKFIADPSKDAVLNADVTSDGIYSYGVAKAENATYAAGDIVTLTFRADQVGTANLVLMENSATIEKGVGYKTKEGEGQKIAIEIVEASKDITVNVIGSESNMDNFSYDVDGHKLSVKNDQACRVFYVEDETRKTISYKDVTNGYYNYDVPESVNEVTIVVKADVNGNGIVNSADVMLINRSLLLSTHPAWAKLDSFAYEIADINGNGEVNSADVMLINRSLLLGTHPAYKLLDW